MFTLKRFKKAQQELDKEFPQLSKEHIKDIFKGVGIILLLIVILSIC